MEEYRNKVYAYVCDNGGEVKLTEIWEKIGSFWQHPEGMGKSMKRVLEEDEQSRFSISFKRDRNGQIMYRARLRDVYGSDIKIAYGKQAMEKINLENYLDKIHCSLLEYDEPMNLSSDPWSFGMIRKLIPELKGKALKTILLEDTKSRFILEFIGEPNEGQWHVRGTGGITNLEDYLEQVCRHLRRRGDIPILDVAEKFGPIDEFVPEGENRELKTRLLEDTQSRFTLEFKGEPNKGQWYVRASRGIINMGLYLDKVYRCLCKKSMSIAAVAKKFGPVDHFVPEGERKELKTIFLEDTQSRFILEFIGKPKKGKWHVRAKPLEKEEPVITDYQDYFNKVYDHLCKTRQSMFVGAISQMFGSVKKFKKGKMWVFFQKDSKSRFYIEILRFTKIGDIEWGVGPRFGEIRVSVSNSAMDNEAVPDRAHSS